MLVTLYVEGLSMAWCICPSPTGEARWGLKMICLRNLSLPFRGDLERLPYEGG